MGLMPIKHTIQELNRENFVLRAMMYQGGYTIKDIKLKYIFKNKVSGVKYIHEKYSFSATKINHDLLLEILTTKAIKNAKTEKTGTFETVKNGGGSPLN